MKILVCTDGSAPSKKALTKALEVAEGCSADEVTLINVQEDKYNFPAAAHDRIPLTPEDIKRFEALGEQELEEKRKMLVGEAKPFEEKGIKVSVVVTCGHPAETIATYAAEGGYDMIVIGSRGLGGIKKLLLGSVSSAVLQEARCSVLVVK